MRLVIRCTGLWRQSLSPGMIWLTVAAGLLGGSGLTGGGQAYAQQHNSRDSSHVPYSARGTGLYHRTGIAHAFWDGAVGGLMWEREAVVPWRFGSTPEDTSEACLLPYRSRKGLVHFLGRNRLENVGNQFCGVLHSMMRQSVLESHVGVQGAFSAFYLADPSSGAAIVAAVNNGDTGVRLRMSEPACSPEGILHRAPCFGAVEGRKVRRQAPALPRPSSLSAAVSKWTDAWGAGRKPSITVEDSRAQESTSGIGFTARDSDSTETEVRVDYETLAVPAAPDDFVSRVGAQSLAPREWTNTLRIPIVASHTEKGDEAFSVQLSNPVHGAFEQAL